MEAISVVFVVIGVLLAAIILMSSLVLLITFGALIWILFISDIIFALIFSIIKKKEGGK